MNSDTYSLALLSDGSATTGDVAAWGCGTDRARAICSSILARRSGGCCVVWRSQGGAAGMVDGAPDWPSEADLRCSMGLSTFNIRDAVAPAGPARRGSFRTFVGGEG